MAEFGRLETLSGVKAAADLSGKQYHFVRLSAANQCNQASEAANSGLAGVLQNKPRADEFATIGYSGLTKIFAGGAITANDIITTNGSGRAAVVTSGQMAAGRALVAATADGDIITALLWAPVKWFGAP